MNERENLISRLESAIKGTYDDFDEIRDLFAEVLDSKSDVSIGMSREELSARIKNIALSGELSMENVVKETNIDELIKEFFDSIRKPKNVVAKYEAKYNPRIDEEFSAEAILANDKHTYFSLYTEWGTLLKAGKIYIVTIQEQDNE